MWEHAELYLTLGGFIVTAFAAATRVTWKLTRVEISLREEIASSRTEVETRQDEKSREVGETISALKEQLRIVEQRWSEKIREIELYCRDTFVRRDGFYKVREEMANDIRALGEKLEQRLERMEAKIDSKT